MCKSTNIILTFLVITFSTVVQGQPRDYWKEFEEWQSQERSEDALTIWTGNVEPLPVELGTLASSEEMCAIFEHPIFDESFWRHERATKANGYMVFDGALPAGLWIYQKLEDKGLRLDAGWSLYDDTLEIADRRLSECLRQIYTEDEDLYLKIQWHYLEYLNYEKRKDDLCFFPKTEKRTFINDDGTRVEKEVEVGQDMCLQRFGLVPPLSTRKIDPGFAPIFPPATFSTMLIWKEAHEVLKRVLDDGQKEMFP